jgi:hypothetical protein
LLISSPWALRKWWMSGCSPSDTSSCRGATRYHSSIRLQ